MDLVHELCSLQLLEVTKKSDTWAGWLASIQHLAHIHIFSLPRIRLRLILIMKCILWALTVSYNERECSSNASATKIKGETFKMHLILKVLLSISRRKVQCKINWKTSLSKSFHIYFLEDHHYLIFALCWREKIECLQDRNQHRVAAGQ